MTAYLDTSALAKWYVAEPESERFEVWLSETADAVISRLTIVEMRCLLARRRRSGALTPALESRAYGRFMEQLAAGQFRLLPMTDSLPGDALSLIERLPSVPLRTLDALHLAAARLAAATIVATADLVMREAATALGLKVEFFGPIA